LCDTIRFRSSAQILEEIGKAVPLYAGIGELTKEGDSLQWGGASFLPTDSLRLTEGRGSR
jgi:hypothetical protein